MSKKKQATQPVPASDGQHLTLIMGYPASGKSSLVAKKFPGLYHANRDKAGGSLQDLANDVYYALKLGKSVVSDNLFATRESRKNFIDVAKMCNVPVRCVVLDTDIEDAQVNVVMRLIKHFGHFPTSEEIKGAKHPNIFPPAVLFKFRKEYEDPKVEEGFESIERVPFVRDPWPGDQKAVIFDLDGTVRETISGGKFPTDPADIKVRSGAKEAVAAVKKAGYRLLGASNQSGIAKGQLTEKQCVACIDQTCSLLGNKIEVLFCPHSIPPISCYCRKPMPGMLVAHIVKHKLDPAKCLLVGDMTTDKTCAGRVGMPYMHADAFLAGGYKDLS